MITEKMQSVLIVYDQSKTKYILYVNFLIKIYNFLIKMVNKMISYKNIKC